MEAAIYLSSAFLLLLFAYMVFRRVVRRDYRRRGRLGPMASMAQLLVFLGYFTFPYVFSPPNWPWFWEMKGPTSQPLQIVGLALTLLGMIAAFGTMAWFGLAKALGVQVEGITRTGPYRFSRNPQIVGGYCLVLGVFLQWPSLPMAGWALMYAFIGHWMITTEEEHLSRVFGDEYEAYCSEVPRYLRLPVD